MINSDLVIEQRKYQKQKVLLISSCVIIGLSVILAHLMNAQTAHDMVCVKSTSIVKARLVKKEIYKVMTEQVCWFQVLV